jgi:ADP-ribose pyrophosphatase YjhB (NUDIX family)
MSRAPRPILARIRWPNRNEQSLLANSESCSPLRRSGQASLRAAFFERKMMNIQVAALPFRRSKKGVTQVLLMTTRRGRRWIVPKGNPQKRRSARKAACSEALDEAGVTGVVGRKPIGAFRHKKRGGRQHVYLVRVFPMRVVKQLKAWREQGERRVEWMATKAAVRRVANKRLKSIIRRL